jgi:hypothetical protein
MRLVRQRVLRRRRRRWAAAGTTAAALSAVTLATLLHNPAERPPAPVATQPAPGPSTDAPEVRFPDLGGLTIRLPRGWSALSGPTAGFVADQPLDGDTPCPLTPVANDAYCPTPPRLAGGTTVVSFTPIGDATNPPEASGLTEKNVMEPCRRAGGTRQLYAVQVGGYGGSNVAVLVSVCLRKPYDHALETIRSMLASARFGDDAVPAPSGTDLRLSTANPQSFTGTSS